MMITQLNAIGWILRHRAIILRSVAGIVLGFLIAFIIHTAQKPPRTIQLDPITTVIEVPVDRLTTKVVTEYVPVEDRAAVNRLFADNKRLNATVQQLTVSLAEATSSGRGEVVITIPPSPTLPPLVIDRPISVTFKDWRLSFQSDGTVGTYTLTQKYSILNSVGRDKNNTPVQIVRLYEIDAQGERIAIPTVETTTITVAPNQIRFYVKPTFQGGLAILPTGTSYASAESTVTYNTGFAIGMPWLKRGTTEAVETTRYAYFTPIITVNNADFTAGLLPVSLNVGTLKYLPLTDLWISPYVGVSVKDANAKRFGVIFSTTF